MLIKLGNSTMDESQLREFMIGFYNRWRPMLDLDIPVISALQGDCIGVAPVFACAPDIALADETFILQVTFAGLNFYPGMGIAYLLARKAGESRAAFQPDGSLQRPGHIRDEGEKAPSDLNHPCPVAISSHARRTNRFAVPDFTWRIGSAARFH